jgi:uncharacterized membrane protein
MPPHKHPTDHELECSVADMLLIGVLTATAIVLIGTALYLRHPLQPTPDYRHFTAADPNLRSLAGIWQGALHGHAVSFIQLGLVVLIATPIARVALCLLGFARQRDRLYAAISAIVLIILIYSLANPR